MRASTRPQRGGEAEAIGRAFARSVDLLYSGFARASYTESIRALRRIETEHVKKLRKGSVLRLELRRRTAELFLEQSLVHGCPLSVCRRRLKIAQRIGWSGVDRELHFSLLFARGMIARGHFRTATAISNHCISSAQRELRKIENHFPRRGRKYFLDGITHFQEVLNRVCESKVKTFSSQSDVGGRTTRKLADGRG